MRSRRLVIIAIVSVLIGGLFVSYLRYRALHPRTEDAYVQAHIVEVAARVSGPAVKVYVSENDYVEAGAPLFDIDPSTFEANVAAATANYEIAVQMMGANGAAVGVALSNLEEKEVILSRAKRNLERAEALFKENLIANAKYDNTRATYAEAVAGVSSARSDLRRAESEFGKEGEYNARLRQASAHLRLANLEMSFTKIISPTAGWVSNKALREGTMVIAEKPQFSVVESKHWWVEANFKETDLTNIEPGLKARIKIDMYPELLLVGEVESLGAGSGAVFSLLPPENATGNWVKVTQRFPVRIKILKRVDEENGLKPLRVGSSAVVTIDIE